MTTEQALEKARKVLKDAGMGGLGRLHYDKLVAAALLEAYAKGLEYGMPAAGASPSPTFGSSGRPDRIMQAEKLRTAAARLRGDK